MDPPVVWKVYHRVHQAAALAEFVSRPGSSKGEDDLELPGSEEEWLRWVLIEYWQKAGLARRYYGLDVDEE